MTSLTDEKPAYKIVFGDLGKIEKTVATELSKGYKLYGPPFSAQSSSGPVVAQALTYSAPGAPAHMVNTNHMQR